MIVWEIVDQKCNVWSSNSHYSVDHQMLNTYVLHFSDSHATVYYHSKT